MLTTDPPCHPLGILMEGLTHVLSQPQVAIRGTAMFSALLLDSFVTPAGFLLMSTIGTQLSRLWMWFHLNWVGKNET